MTSMLPLTTDLIRAFGWTLLHSFWQAFCVYACLRVVLKLWPMASSAIKYHLSFLSLAGISAWFAYTFWNQLSVIKAERVVEQMTVTFGTGNVQSLMTALPQEASGLQMMLPGMETYFPLIVAAYAIGVGVMTVKLCIDLVQLRQMKRQDVLPMDNTWKEHLVKLAGSMGVSRKVELFISKHLQVPVMIGFIRPVILLPAAMVSNLSTDQLEAILLHELAHIKRNDYLLNIFQSVVETILFFNPFVWWISKNIRLEREHCCDDLVISGTVQPLQYARALVALEEYRLTVNPMAMAAADDKHHLLHRIKRIMEMKRTNLNYSQRLLAMLIIVMGLVSIAWLNPAAKADTTKDQAIHMDSLPMMAATFAPPAITPVLDFTDIDLRATSACLDTIPHITVAGYATIAADTAPKAKRKYIIKSDSGQVKEYNSLTEMSTEDLKKFEENYQRMQEAQLRAFHWQQNMKPEEMEKIQKQVMENMKNVDWAKMNKNLAITMKQIDWTRMNKDIAAAMSNVDWNKVNKQVAESMKNVDMKKLQLQIQESMKNVDMNKLQLQIQENMKKIDWEKMNKQIEENMKKIDWDAINKELKEQGLNAAERSRLKMEMMNQFKREQLANRQNTMALMNNARAAQQNAYYLQNQHVYATTVAPQQYTVTYPAGNVASTTAPAEIYLRQQHAVEASKEAYAKAMAEAQRANAARVIYQNTYPLTIADAGARPHVYYQAPGGQAANVYGYQDADVRTFLSSLENDNLIDRSGNFEVEKRNGKLYINGKKQSSSVYRKHAQYLQRDGVSITQESEGTIMIEEKK